MSADEAGPREGFGSVRVQATVGSTTWHTSLFPDATTGSFVLPVKKPVRLAEGLAAGASCEVTLEVRPAEAAVLELGATRHEHQPGTTFRVFLDPAGHPFCLCLD